MERAGRANIRGRDAIEASMMPAHQLQFLLQLSPLIGRIAIRDTGSSKSSAGNIRMGRRRGGSGLHSSSSSKFRGVARASHSRTKLQSRCVFGCSLNTVSG